MFPFNPHGSFAEIVRLFGDPHITIDQYGNMHVSNRWESENMVLINTPLQLPKRVYCHKVFAPILTSILFDISDAGLDDFIYTWDGCFNVRKIKGSDKPSAHSLGIAVDLNAAHNKLGLAWENNPDPKRMEPELIVIFKRHGCVWGNEFKRPDPMHFSLVYW